MQIFAVTPRKVGHYIKKKEQWAQIFAAVKGKLDITLKKKEKNNKHKYLERSK